MRTPLVGAAPYVACVDRLTRAHAITGFLLTADRDDKQSCGRVDRHLHTDDDAICPRCLRWIDGRDFVRQTAFGPLQHEVCPP